LIDAFLQLTQAIAKDTVKTETLFGVVEGKFAESQGAVAKEMKSDLLIKALYPRLIQQYLGSIHPNKEDNHSLTNEMDHIDKLI